MQNKVNKPEDDFKVVGDWEAQSRILKEKFPQLTKADLIYEKDHEADLLERIQKRLNKKRVEVINIIRKGLSIGERRVARL
ncbi:hypothetical protein [Niabella hibiscisoli]|uniref:hypothetical protein n=1 Tax=Niabella hibiscisoli TaxID=1825928 RepID=UPI001F0EBA1E|nr:hypothetical protein [Niabella hibiscisoli]MCH5719398.1 hypothetical protein [Niabella hibiscisoli]